MAADADTLRVALAQIAPVWLDREATLAKVERYVAQAADEGCGLVAFGEALVPGYPHWLSFTDGSRFESARQKAIHAVYLEQAVAIEDGHLDGVCALARERGIAVVLGIIERPADRGAHSLYCTLVTILPDGQVASAHRKLVPTYEERLAWAPGDGHGLQVHRLGGFRLGALNCWENWMPLTRAALHAQGEDLHVASWPGSRRLTEDITRFIAKEGRSFVLSASSLLRKADIPAGFPEYEAIVAAAPDVLADGGACIAGPDGRWVVEPVVGEEALITAELDAARIREERQNFDASGHYSRPDVTRLVVNRERQQIVQEVGDDD
ncbi:MAG: carbon-nitrogen hydrolase family protein [Planctomycetota bacterium]|nr:carbon-nitrogen hydrolase family protein [Planctomycetota bacterium]